MTWVGGRPPSISRQEGGKRADYKLRFFAFLLVGTAGLAAALSGAMQADPNRNPDPR